MSRFDPVTPTKYRNKYWQRFTSYAFSAHENLAPLVSIEIAQAVHAMPMAFIKQQDKFLLVGVLSLTSRHNMFVDDQGRWVGRYIPACFRSYPFSSIRSKNKNGLILCVDEESGLISDMNGKKFFDKDGKITKSLEEIGNFLNQVEKSRSVTTQAVNALADADLITEWHLQSAGTQMKITGLYRIDETRLNGIDAPLFLQLRKAQALPIAYAQLLSMNNVSIIEKMSQITKKTQPKEEPKSDFQNLLASDDMISFD